MKRIGFLLSTISLFAISLYLAYYQAMHYLPMDSNSSLLLPLSKTFSASSGFFNAFYSFFAYLLSVLSSFFAGNILFAVVALAFIVELITLYPAVNIQLKQKKIHLFHKKLVNRFLNGDLSMSENKRELDVLYSVNESIHRRGAILVLFQMIVFLSVLFSLQAILKSPHLLSSYISDFSYSLFSSHAGVFLSAFVGLSYFAHSLIKIYLKQKEDYIDANQVYMALSVALVSSAVAFYFAGVFSILLSIYFVSQITFSSIRYVIVENKSKKWGKFVQKDLIKMLKHSRLHKDKWEHLSRKFNHLALVRYLNFHLLEEAVSMSLALMLLINTTIFV